MSQSTTFKCPSCGAWLNFDPETQGFLCPFCEQSFTEDELLRMSADRAPVDDEPAGTHVQSYRCQQCGAELVTEDTTAATHCYFCHSPVVLTGQLTEEYYPQGIIPFAMDKDRALSAMQEHLARKKYLNRHILDPKEQEQVYGVYYPYWMGATRGEVSFKGEATKTTSTRGVNCTYYTTHYYRIRREATYHLRNIPCKGLSKADRLLSDGVHPYRMEGLKPFSTGYLSGFLAEKWDIPKIDVLPEMEKIGKNFAKGRIGEKSGYDTMSGTTDCQVQRTDADFNLLPAWVLTFRNRENASKPFFFMMNGQTGQICGKLPVNWKKLSLHAAALGAAVTGLLCLGGAFLW